jgi:hypothetical protein
MSAGFFIYNDNRLEGTEARQGGKAHEYLCGNDILRAG